MSYEEHFHTTAESQASCYRRGEGCLMASELQVHDRRPHAERIMKFAERNYEKGFDWIVECQTVDSIVEEMLEYGMVSYAQIKAHYAMVTSVREDRIADAKNSAF